MFAGIIKKKAIGFDNKEEIDLVGQVGWSAWVYRPLWVNEEAYNIWVSIKVISASPRELGTGEGYPQKEGKDPHSFFTGVILTQLWGSRPSMPLIVTKFTRLYNPHESKGTYHTSLNDREQNEGWWRKKDRIDGWRVLSRALFGTNTGCCL